MPVPRICRCSCGNTQDPGPVGETMLTELLFVHLKQRTEIWCDMRERIRLYLL